MARGKALGRKGGRNTGTQRSRQGKRLAAMTGSKGRQGGGSEGINSCHKETRETHLAALRGTRPGRAGKAAPEGHIQGRKKIHKRIWGGKKTNEREKERRLIMVTNENNTKGRMISRTLQEASRRNEEKSEGKMR